MRDAESHAAEHASDERLNAFADGELPDLDSAVVELHLAQCQACGDRLATIRGVFDDLDAVPDARLAHDLAPSILAKIRALREVDPAPSVVPAERLSFDIGAMPRALRWALLPQLLVAIALLAVALPLIAGDAPVLDSAASWLPAPSGHLASVAQAVGNLDETWPQMTDQLASLTEQVTSSLGELSRLAPSSALGATFSSIETLELAALAVIALLILIVGNGALLSAAVTRHQNGDTHA